MNSIGCRGFPIVQGSIRLDVIYVLVFPAYFRHKTVRQTAASSEFFLGRSVEILHLPVNCALHYDRLARMSLHHPVNEGTETLLNHWNVRIGEWIEHIGIRIYFLEDIGEIRLHLAISAETECNRLQTCTAHELNRV